MQLNNIRNHVVVITDAASGLGLTTARMAAARGARVVLAAEDEQLLRAEVDSIREAGGEASFVATDSNQPGARDEVASFVLDRYGRIDTWVDHKGFGSLVSWTSPAQIFRWLRSFPLVTTHLEFQSAIRA